MTHQFLSTRAALLAATLSMASAQPLGAQRTIDLGRAATSTVSLRISGTFAELRIRGWDRDSIALSGSIPTDARLDGGFGGSPSRPVGGAKFYMETASGVPAGKLELRVPAGARVWAKSGTADIDVEGVTGGLDLNIVGGSVRVSGTPHELSVESMDGGVTIEGSASWLRVKTATGDITLSGSGGEDVALTTVSGAIRVASGRYERARLESVTGAVTFAGDLAPHATLDANTHSGPIELRLSKKASADLDVASVAGTIENALTGRPAVAGREGRGQEIGLMIGSGGARVYLRSFKGHIRLLAR
jgi:putative adhesin